MVRCRSKVSQKMLAALAFCMLWFVTGGVSASDENIDAALLMPGNDDIEVGGYAKTNWYALTSIVDHWELVSTTLSIARSDIDPDVVSIESDKPNALVFIRGSSLREGPVDSASVDSGRAARTLEDAGLKSLSIAFRGSVYTLGLKSGRVVYSSEGRHSILNAKQDAGMITRVSVLWAGDINRDGTLDLLVDLKTEAHSRICMMASLASGNMELVRPIACRFYGG